MQIYTVSFIYIVIKFLLPCIYLNRPIYVFNKHVCSVVDYHVLDCRLIYVLEKYIYGVGCGFILLSIVSFQLRATLRNDAPT